MCTSTRASATVSGSATSRFSSADTSAFSTRGAGFAKCECAFAVGGGAGIPSNGAYHPPEDSGGLTPYKPLWETHQSPEGYTYYYNTTTGETTWEEPEDYDGFS